MKNAIIAAALVLLTAAAPAQAQSAAPEQPAPVNDRAVNPSQPDFTLVALPTTLKMPRFASAFRVTHRFTRSLGAGDFGDLAREFFGFDSGAQIGLEYRFGILPGTQIGIHRTSDRTIQFFAQQHVVGQGTSPVGVDLVATAEGTNNFRDSYSPSIGLVLSRNLGRHGAVYAQPIWVNNTNQLSSDVAEDNNTLMFGFGARLRVRPTVYLVGEAVPRAGFTPNSTHLSFAVEKRAGGHSFQINFSNGFGTTLGQIARGGQDSSTWFIGFNISRKFF
jgi:Membrane bound beta barrel domain (DUF5777)